MINLLDFEFIDGLPKTSHVLAYGIIAVPTGIVTTEMALAVRNKKEKNETCPGCSKEGHDGDALFCKYCSTML